MQVEFETFGQPKRFGRVKVTGDNRQAHQHHPHTLIDFICSADLCEEDQQANEDALAADSRIFSSYKIVDRKMYIITERDRSRSTIMLAAEY